MFILKRLVIKSLNSYVRLYSLGKKSHYDVLNLRRNCTDKEIKEAFIQMSKEYHPDKNKDAKAQEHFVKIVEAYNVLSKASSRAQYDILSSAAAHSASNAYVYKPHVPYNLRKNPQYSYYYETNTQNAQEPQAKKNKSYYGVSGVKKMPNYMIILMCFGFALVGIMIQMVVIRQSFIVHRNTVNERSKLLTEELEKVRAAADGNGNEMQTQLLLEKIVNAANPSVATASLGQALASEKK
ncbi:dnaJ-like protein 60 isoform X2 [Choristoneura fumiferana]